MANQVRDMILASLSQALSHIPIPNLDVIISGYLAYDTALSISQLENIVREIQTSIAKLEASRDLSWYQSENGAAFLLKFIATASEGRQVDKAKYFACALANAADKTFNGEREVLLSILERISKPALIVLAAVIKSAERRKINNDPQVLISEMVNDLKPLGFTPNTANACVQEMASIGIISSTIKYRDDWTVAENYQGGDYGVSDLTFDFARFIQNAH